MPRASSPARWSRSAAAAEAGRRSAPRHAEPRPPSPWIVRFAPLVPAGAPVLDLACGGGRHTRLFLARGHPVTALDRDLGGLEDVAGQRGLEIVAGRPRGRLALAARRPPLRRGRGRQLPLAPALPPTSSRRSTPTASCSTRPSRSATRPTARRATRTSCSCPASCSRPCGATCRSSPTSTAFAHIPGLRSGSASARCAPLGLPRSAHERHTGPAKAHFAGRARRPPTHARDQTRQARLCAGSAIGKHP